MRNRFIPTFSVLVVLGSVPENLPGCLLQIATAEKPGSALTLIEAIQQAGRRKDAGASHRYLELAQELVDTSDMQAVDSKQRTAVHWCVLSAQSALSSRLRDAYSRLLKELLNAGAEVNAQDWYGNTPLDYQRQSAAQEIEQVLIEQGGEYGYTQSAEARILHLLDQVRQAEGENDLNRLHTLLESDLPANSVLSVRLLTRLASHVSRAGDPVEAVVTAPLEVEGRITVTAGTKMEGTVLNAQRASNKYQQAQLEIDFCNLIDRSGTITPIALILTDVDNARERVQEGRIIGIPFPQAFAERLSWGIRMVGMAHPLLAYALEAASLGWQKEFSREIILEPGVDMSLKIMAPEKSKELPGDSVPVMEIPSGLAEIIQGFPLRTTTAGNVPSDLVNVLLVGSQSQLAKAFESTGWLQAQKLSLTSGLKTFSSLAEQKGYSEAPVSLLLLDGKKPDLVYQKQTNTFAKRHHIRIWKNSQSYQGRELWLGAATHDIGIRVMKGGTRWVHRIDPQVDREQAKVKDDLLFTGCVGWFSLVERPAVPQRTMNATGDEIRTVGKLLVLSLIPGTDDGK
jgi:hypothetical protein